jgi:hypothetical protein
VAQPAGQFTFSSSLGPLFQLASDFCMRQPRLGFLLYGFAHSAILFSKTDFGVT